MNEIKMTVKEAIEQLNDLKRDREGFAKNDEPDSVFAYDIKAIDVAIKVMEMIIDEMPTIEAEPIKHGKWEGYIRSVFHGTDEDGNPIYRDVTVWQCQRCSRKTVIKENYCPNCGAKMEE